MYEPRADELHEGFPYEEFLNMQRRDETDQHQAEAAWGRTRYSHPIDRASRPSIDINPSTSINVAHTTSIDIRSKPKTTVSEKDKVDNEYLTPDEFGIFRDPDGYARAIDGQEYDEDYEEERATEYKAILDEEDTLLHHSSWKRNAPSIDMTGSPSIDTQPHQRNRK
ncbi:hypothetical protein F2Q70_00038713 [Brassica cretica]|uniref:Uncharacterized protein n=1 Tax=Brassica cretica TaxID=69181 RepID=A0A8S9K9Y4_BRACR|nr:hypothetical protein F2Q70_00038713 [Brassica cretica]